MSRFESLDTVREIAVAPTADGYLRTTEAAAYLRFRSPSGIRTAVMRRELQPAGVGPRGTLLFRREDLDQFVRHEAEWYPLAAAMAWTGLRFGEATALEWDDLDEQQNIIRVRRAQWRSHVGKA